jgi:hypothetical protein
LYEYTEEDGAICWAVYARLDARGNPVTEHRIVSCAVVFEKEKSEVLFWQYLKALERVKAQGMPEEVGEPVRSPGAKVAMIEKLAGEIRSLAKGLIVSS